MVTYMAAAQKERGYGKIIKDWIIRSESLQIFVFLVRKDYL